MSAPAIPKDRATQLPGRRESRAFDRWAGVVEGWLKGHALLVYAFLYIPIVIVVVFAFNDTNRRVTAWDGFSTKWFDVALNNGVVQKALLNSFLVAIPNAILATVFGTMAALGLQRVGKKTRLLFDALTYTSIIVPEIVIALATLVLFATSFDVIEATTGITINFGHPTIIAAHVLFNTSLVLLLVRARLSGMDRTLVEASSDLFATPIRTFLQITFPILLPAIIAGFLLAFAFSFDDYVITTFVSGPGSSTLPLFIFGQVKRGVTPETNAVATMILAFTIGMLLIAQIALTWQGRRQGRKGGDVASIVSQQAA
jgi:spermidine/putrescine transport system permease protein